MQLHQPKSFCTAKKITEKSDETTYRTVENICELYIWQLISKVCKELNNSITTPVILTEFKNWVKDSKGLKIKMHNKNKHWGKYKNRIPFEASRKQKKEVRKMRTQKLKEETTDLQKRALLVGMVGILIIWEADLWSCDLHHRAGSAN